MTKRMTKAQARAILLLRRSGMTSGGQKQAEEARRTLRRRKRRSQYMKQLDRARKDRKKGKNIFGIKVG